MATKKAIVRALSPTQFVVSIGVTANLGNFESARVDLSATYEVPEGAKIEDMHDSACSQVEELFGLQADRFGDVISTLLQSGNSKPPTKKGK